VRDGTRAFGESQGRLSVHVRREDSVKLSAKAASPVGRQCVTFAESFLSAKASTRGKGPSPRGSPLSMKAPNLVVFHSLIKHQCVTQRCWVRLLVVANLLGFNVTCGDFVNLEDLLILSSKMLLEVGVV
jgi:hypothetical protein